MWGLFSMSNEAKVKEQLEKAFLLNLGKIHYNLNIPELTEEAFSRGEGCFTDTGALAVKTGKYTGRSPKDRFFVDTESVHDKIKWGDTNKPITVETYNKLYYRLGAYLEDTDLYVFDGFIGADPNHRLKIRVVNQLAWQNAFIHQLLVRPKPEDLVDFVPDFTVICAPGFKAIPYVDGINSEAFIVINFDEKEVLIGASMYAGEIKKACFTVMNYLMPKQDVFPMHCSANEDEEGNTALFFGLSGTGKTTLSADPLRSLIGDDEHGWSEEGIFNFEGGCYAKCINLTQEGEPQIWEAIKFGAIIENVVLDPETRVPDFFDKSITENTRVGYPLNYIPNAVESGQGGHPKAIIFLTADAFGVLPPISKLDINQACYHFISGYTSKLAGTERGITEPQATFSACFGEPFMPRPIAVYSQMLHDKIEKYQPDVYLLNTGWTGGSYGEGSRIKLRYTRAMVTAALNGTLAKGEFKTEPAFGFSVPVHCPDVPDEIMDVRSSWKDKDKYDETAAKLADLFAKNFSKFSGIDPAVANAGPKKQK